MLTTDKNQTGSRRSKPNSCSLLLNDQLNPWDRLQPQDKKSRHRGTNHLRQCELSKDISLLSQKYLISRYAVPISMQNIPDQFDQLSLLFDLLILQLSLFYQSTRHSITTRIEQNLCSPPLLFRRPPSQRNYHCKKIKLN